MYVVRTTYLRRIKLDPGFALDEGGADLHYDRLDGVRRAPALSNSKLKIDY